MLLKEAKKIILKNPEAKREYNALKWRYTIGKKLAERRMELAISQIDLAEKCGVTQSQISRSETGEKVSPEILNKIADTLGLLLQEVPEYCNLIREGSCSF